MATPSIPPRPARSQDTLAPQAAGAPTIPPRPAGKREAIERSTSQERYARSPLNDPSFTHKPRKPSQESAPRPTTIRRPPSISSLPLVGQEGNEYATPDELEPVVSPPDQTKHISKDLPLHAPTAEVPASAAKARIQGVTRTDSERAAIASVSKLVAENTTGKPGTPRSGASSSGNTRPPSIYKDEEEKGVPSFGLSVPMLKFAGDVQAPSPAPSGHRKQPSQEGAPTAGHRGGRHHTRTRSGRDIFTGPPGTYGMHGHQHRPHNDPMEQEWYQKHPDEAAREAKGEYGPYIQADRKDYHLSRERLDELVHVKLPGLGTSAKVIGIPAEEIGYNASEEFLTRIASNTSQGIGGPAPVEEAKPRRSSSQTHAESPLRKTSLPEEELARASQAIADDKLDSKIHVDEPSKRHTKIGGGYNYDGAGPDFGSEGGNTSAKGGYYTEDGYGIPILASDEVERHPGEMGLHPAVSPELERERRASADVRDVRKVPSRPQSRNKSIDRNGLARFNSREEDRSRTPLDYVKEYEPLFPEDDEKPQPKKAIPAEVPKRPDLARHHFPSKDIWEDAPNHVYLETTVETPELPEETNEEEAEAPVKVFERPEHEEARKNVITKQDQESFLSDRTKQLAKTHLNADVLSDMPTRPGMKQRFPSQDIWEDAPSHVYQTTTVDTPEEEDAENPEFTSPEVEPREKPVVPARPVKLPAAEAFSEERKAPSIPERPKPKVPARPIKSSDAFAPREDSPLSKVISADAPEPETSGEAPAPKQKPVVPARPGGKIAALKGSFLSDLNSRLQLGPQAPKAKEPEKEEEPEQEKAPLADARKGRAKGPSRRKPTASPSGAAAAPGAAGASKPVVSLSVSSVQTLWSVSGKGLHFDKHESSSMQKQTPKPSSIETPASTTIEGTTSTGIDEAPVASISTAAEDDVASPKSATTEHATQTGQMDVKITSPTGEKEEFTTYVGGGKDGGNVVVNSEGKEHASGKLPATETEVPIGQNTDSIVEKPVVANDQTKADKREAVESTEKTATTS